jgi:O-antigen/teichoic acid export membrane protein
LNLAASDFLAKTLNFLTFVYLARVLGLHTYGILEFALSSSLYFLMLADAGVESWATREAAKGTNLTETASRVLPIRMGLAAIVFVFLLLTIPFFPDYEGLSLLLILFGLGAFTQAASLKWVFLGRHEMSTVGKGLVLMQFSFVLLVVLFVRDSKYVVMVPVFRLIGECLMALQFWVLFRKKYGKLQWRFTAQDARKILIPSFVLGASLLLGLMSYNLDSVLLGFFIGPQAVGLYNAAYKPVTVALAMPVTYFIGLFPALAQAHAEGEGPFRKIVDRSFQFTILFSIPVAVGGYFLAAPIVLFLFGANYAGSIPVLQILIWSAALAILRGTYKHGLVAAGKQNLDLRSALIAASANVALNLVLIPKYGPIGAAVATVAAESLWLLLSSYYMKRNVTSVGLLSQLIRPLTAGVVMGLFLWQTPGWYWVFRGAGSVLLYAGILYVLLRLR